jgi:hypothetical protein
MIQAFLSNIAMNPISQSCDIDIRLRQMSAEYRVLGMLSLSAASSPTLVQIIVPPLAVFISCAIPE